MAEQFRGSYTVTTTGVIPNVAPGNYFLLFKVDGNNQQGETNENNNTFQAVPITLSAADLQVTGLTFDPAPPRRFSASLPVWCCCSSPARPRPVKPKVPATSGTATSGS